MLPSVAFTDCGWIKNSVEETIISQYNAFNYKHTPGLFADTEGSGLEDTDETKTQNNTIHFIACFAMMQQSA